MTNDKYADKMTEKTTDQPLGMTVHSLPHPSANRTKNGRLKMLMVLMLCAAPVVASYFTYYVIRPEGRTNFGELINPQRPAPPLVATALDGSSVPIQSLKGQWLLVSVAGGACDTACQNYLYLQRQMRESLGKEKERLDWIWLVSDDAALPDTLLPALKGAKVLRLPSATLATWLMPAKDQKLSDHLYLVDPRGNWMMRFPANFKAETAMKAKKDIERVLRASASWDSAGR